MKCELCDKESVYSCDCLTVDYFLSSRKEETQAVTGVQQIGICEDCLKEMIKNTVRINDRIRNAKYAQELEKDFGKPVVKKEMVQNSIRSLRAAWIGFALVILALIIGSYLMSLGADTITRNGRPGFTIAGYVLWFGSVLAYCLVLFIFLPMIQKKKLRKEPYRALHLLRLKKAFKNDSTELLVPVGDSFYTGRDDFEMVNPLLLPNIKIKLYDSFISNGKWKNADFTALNITSDERSRTAGANEWKCPKCGKINQNYVGSCGCGHLKGQPFNANETKETVSQKRTFEPFTGSGNCDVCNRPLSGVKAWLVPNDVFYSSRQYREVMKMALRMAGKQGTEAEIDFMRLTDSSPYSAVCENCIGMFDGEPLSLISASAPTSAPDVTDNLLIYMDIDKLGDGAYGLASGQVVAKAVPASMMEGIIVSDGDSKATLYGSANECVVGLKGRSSALDTIEQKLRADAELTGVLSATGIKRGKTDEPLVVDGPVKNGVLETMPGQSMSLCIAGFNSVWKKSE